MAEKAIQPRYIVGLRWTARIITIACLGFWLFFNVASYISESAGGVEGAANHLIMTVVIIALLLLTFFFEQLAALIFIWLGIATYIQWGQQNIFVAFLMSFALVLVGLMFLYIWWLGWQHKREQRG